MNTVCLSMTIKSLCTSAMTALFVDFHTRYLPATNVIKAAAAVTRAAITSAFQMDVGPATAILHLFLLTEFVGRLPRHIRRLRMLRSLALSRELYRFYVPDRVHEARPSGLVQSGNSCL